MRSLKQLIPLALTLLLTGCATVMMGGPSWLAIETDPEQVLIRLEGVQNKEVVQRYAPFRIQLDKSSDYRLTIQTPGYVSDEIMINRHINGWTFGNLLTIVPIGFVVDFMTDNMWDHNKHRLLLDCRLLAEAPDTLDLELPFQIEKEDGVEVVWVPCHFQRRE